MMGFQNNFQQNNFFSQNFNMQQLHQQMPTNLNNIQIIDRTSNNGIPVPRMINENDKNMIHNNMIQNQFMSNS